MLQDLTIQSSWVEGLVDTFTSRELHKRALVGWPPTDQSLEALQELEDRGYTEVRWRAPNAQCFTCNDLNDQMWTLDWFLYYTKHESPVFSKSHVGCRCFLIVTGIDQTTGVELEQQTVSAY